MIDAHDVKDGVSVTDVRRVALRRAAGAAPGACCRVQLRVLDESTSGEHKFKVMSLLLGGADAHNLQTFSLRVANAAAQDSKAPAAKARRPRRGRTRREREHG